MIFMGFWMVLGYHLRQSHMRFIRMCSDTMANHQPPFRRWTHRRCPVASRMTHSGHAAGKHCTWCGKTLHLVREKSRGKVTRKSHSKSKFASFFDQTIDLSNYCNFSLSLFLSFSLPYQQWSVKALLYKTHMSGFSRAT